MAASVIRPVQACLNKATRQQTALAASKVGLFKSSFVPDTGTTRAELIAAECDFDGYAQQAIAAWLAPYIFPAGGAAIESGTVQFNSTPAVPANLNNVGGWWLETAAGKLELVGTFAAPVPMGAAGQSIPLSIEDITGTGQSF